MNNILVKPYELSIWDSELTDKEQKIAIIGTDSLKAPNMAYNIVFHRNKNGEKTLSFCLKYKYLNHNTGKLEENPFVPYLINERKVKLYYNNEWYDFIIKEIEESSEEYTWSYTAYDAFVLELSKNGYDITFSNELNNNLGTAQQLAGKTLENTDWEVIDLDVGEPIINEPTYHGETLRDISVKRMDDDTDVIIPAHTEILIFYSYIANKNGKFLQFIKVEDDVKNYDIDSHNNITALNYRFNTDVTFKVVETGGSPFYYIDDLAGNHLITYDYIYKDYEVYRTIYQQLVCHDPVMNKIVDEYEYEEDYKKTKVYHYTDSIYSTSNVIVSFITNGDHFNTYEDGSLQGWNTYTPGGHATIELATYPNIDPLDPIVDIDQIKRLEGYLQVRFNKENNGTTSSLFNTGIQNNHSLIQRITKGDKFVFRYRAGKNSVEHGIPQKLSGNELEIKVAFYEEIEETIDDVKRFINKPTTTILHFFHDQNQHPARILNNTITEGSINNTHTSYRLNGVEQEPSSKFLYNDTASNINYYWDGTQYTQYTTNVNFLNYYYLVASAITNVTPEQLQDPNIKIGIFISPTNNTDNNYYYLQDVQLTRYYPSEISIAQNSEEKYPLTIGNIPTAKVLSTDYFYLAPEPTEDKNKIILYLTLNELEAAMGWPRNTVKPVYNRGNIIFIDTNEDIYRVRKEQLRKIYEQFHVKGYALNKVSSIEASHSNCFDILQTIAENFECWIDLCVEHNEDGSIFYDDEGNTLKTVFLRRYSGAENFAGFKYGINLNNITRNVDSNEIVTKLIVDSSQTDLVDSGVISIAGAQSNFNKESYIFNFDYFLNQGLLPRQAFTEDLDDFNTNINLLNTNLQFFQTLEREKSNALVKINSNRNVYSELLSEAKKNLNEALDEFKSLTTYTYAEYQQETDIDRKSELLKIDKVKDIIGKIYNCYAIDNSYRGLYANTDTEYASLYRDLYGMTDHYIKISCINDSPKIVHIELDDYIIPFKFKLNGDTYQTSLSQKVFDIEVSSFNGLVISSIDYNTDQTTGYSLQNTNNQSISSITINPNAVQTYVLKAKTPTKGIKTQINEIIEEKKVLIKAFHIRYSRFILEGTWSSQDYLSDELYYLDALLAGKIAAFPKVTYNIDVVDVSGINAYEGYNFNVGDRTYIEDTEFFGWTYKGNIKTPAKEEVIISEIEKHLDDPTQDSIVVQNYKDHFEDLFQRLQATVQTVDYNEVTYPKTSAILDGQKKINQELLLASLSQIAGLQRPLTTDGSIVIDGDTIKITDLSKRSNVIKISSKGIFISQNGDKEDAYSTLITAEGINIGKVISDYINTKEIWIGNKENPSYRWDSNGLSAFKLLNNGRYDFKQFVRFDQYGLYGINLDSRFNKQAAYDYVVNSLQDVKNDASFAITWDGFFIKNNYDGGGRVEITSENDFRVMNIPRGQSTEQEKIKIGALEWKQANWETGDPIYTDPITVPDEIKAIGPSLYGLRIKNNAGQTVMQTGDDGNLSITNTLRVGVINQNENKTHIVIDGEEANIHSSNFQTGASYGWMINSDGDAYFNNITARGAIKTAVFEYAEIQAVGGIFIFRPSSTIKKAEIAPNGTDLIVEVEKPLLFASLVYKTTEDTTVQSSKTYYKKIDYGYEEVNNPSGNPHAQDFYECFKNYRGSWCKISNYTSDSDGQAQLENILLTNGLTHVYKISNVDISKRQVTLENGVNFINALADTPAEVIKLLDELKGGALVDMGREDRSSNYGVGINSSDNSVNLPPRSISLFETLIDPSKSVKVTYEYKGILGTLPWLRYEGSSGTGNIVVAKIYNDYLKDTQGIYTNNMYIGDANKYIAFYTDNSSNRHLEIKTEKFNLKAGQPNQSGFVYLSTEPYGAYTIPGSTNVDDWKQIIGTKFGITADGTVYASEGHFTGEITANSGKIGNWVIEPINGTYKGGLKTSGYTFGSGVLLTPGYTSASSSGVLSANKTWTIIAGNQFGVTTAGDLYASNADIAGIIKANTGYIGGSTGWTIASQQLYSGTIGTDNSLHLGTKNLGSNTSIAERKGSDWRLTVGSKFGVTNTGVLYASEADIGGKITANSGKIGGWIIEGGKIRSDTDNYSKVAAMQAPSDSITWVFAAGGTTHNSYADCPFRVDKDGNLYATSATFGGTNGITITSSKVTLGSNCSISWDNVTDKSTVANKSDIPTTAQITQISNNAISTATINATQINAENLSVISAKMGTLTSGTITYGTVGSNSSFYLSSTDTSAKIGGQTSAVAGLRLTVGSGFGVTNSGKLYATGVVINGAITATSLTIDGTNYASDIKTISGKATTGYVDSAKSSAEKTATNFITNIDANGIWLTPSGKKPTNTSTGAGATGTRINGDGMQIFNSGTQIASYGSTVKIGKLTKNYLEITDSRINFYDGANSQVFGRIEKGSENRSLILGTFKDEYTYASISAQGQNGAMVLTAQNGTSTSNNWASLTLTSTAWSTAAVSYTQSGGTNYDAILQLTKSKLELYSNGNTDSDVTFSVVPSTGALTIAGSATIGGTLNTGSIIISGSNIRLKNNTSLQGLTTNNLWKSLIYISPTNTVNIGSSDCATYVSGTSFRGSQAYSTSDLRLKTDIIFLDKKSIDLIMKLKPFEYKWNEKQQSFKHEGKYFGLGAQDVIKAMEEVGFSSVNYNIVKKSPDGYYALGYAEFIPHLIKVVQEQHREIEQLKKEIAELKNK